MATRADVSARKPYDIISEPTGTDYGALLRSAIPQCDAGILVFPAGDPSPQSRLLMDRLGANVLSDTSAPMGKIVRFTLNAQVVDILTDTVSSLYQWRKPDLPEDLCLFRRDGSPWLVTVSAEGFGYIEVTPFEKLLLGRNAPELPAALAHQGARDAILAVFERRLESILEDLTVALSDYSRTLVDDGREGLVAALGEWLDSGESSRVSVALEVISRVGLDELFEEIEALEALARGGLITVPTVFTHNSVLSQRWKQLHQARLQRVLDSLDGGDTADES